MVTGISPDNEAFLDRVVATGQFPSREAALDEAVRRLRQQHSPLGSASHFPQSVIQPARIQNREEWLVAFRKWGESHADVTAIADDSRESIYEGRGE
jgi:Arc/MetJ-type ribon-helix-helix transcriptional regulator